MPLRNLTDEELDAMMTALRKLIAELKGPYSPRLEPLKSALAKLDPPKPKAPPSRRSLARPEPQSDAARSRSDNDFTGEE